ncbi:polysaccharide biosynthesis tyrosine autokinase [Cellulomonas edaphi]|uniref:Polysaccharide biosynthesis tyrosine autokinase n=1 Tax=Cellulomonas edaphi TaxID=3053468 RepID=A0ABT7S500_9CELL|nr:polysaccharide biosynthesis tyrosine autokinase [Cellulomons edaphi]MDM7830697.1 polysaccharide biosynthesis tyrosine autokinase [Cellulomons edaphi]
MSLVEFLRTARKHWVWVLVPTLALATLVGYLSWSSTPTYRASASVYVALSAGDTAQDLNQGANYTQGQMLSFARLATLPVVLDPVIEELGLETTARRLGHRIAAATPQNTSILTISATGTDPEATAALANAVARSAADAIEDLAPSSASGRSTVEATIVDKAEAPQQPFAPNTRRNVLAALFAGLLLGLIAGYLREVLDTRVRRPEDVEKAIDVPVVGTLRTVRRGEAQVGPLAAVLAGGPQAEEFRRIRTNLQMIGRVGTPKSFVFSSAVAGEGKSYTSIRVAASFAAAGDRVLLIDADLRRPTVADQLGLEGAAGLTDVLVGRATFDDVVQDVGSAGLRVLASGVIPPNPSELLASREFEDLLASAAGEFDVIIVDAPPLLPVADAVVISRLSTGLLLVIDASKVRRAQIRKAVSSVRLGGGRIAGSVLNRAKVAAAESYAYVRTTGGSSRRKRGRGTKAQHVNRPVPPEPVATTRPISDPAASSARGADAVGAAVVAASAVPAGAKQPVPPAVDVTANRTEAADAGTLSAADEASPEPGADAAADPAVPGDAQQQEQPEHDAQPREEAQSQGDAQLHDDARPLQDDDHGAPVLEDPNLPEPVAATDAVGAPPASDGRASSDAHVERPDASGPETPSVPTPVA